MGKDPDALLTKAAKKKGKRRKMQEIQRKRDQLRKKRRASVATAGKFYAEDGVELVALKTTSLADNQRLQRKRRATLTAMGAPTTDDGVQLTAGGGAGAAGAGACWVRRFYFVARVKQAVGQRESAQRACARGTVIAGAGSWECAGSVR
jgi:hypothetical protein